MVVSGLNQDCIQFILCLTQGCVKAVSDIVRLNCMFDEPDTKPNKSLI